MAFLLVDYSEVSRLPSDDPNYSFIMVATPD